MANTANLGLLLMNLDQDKAEIVFNEAIQIIDALGYGLPSSFTATPPGSPTNGDLVLVALSGTSGVFVGQEGKLAVYHDGTWTFFTVPTRFWSATEIILPYQREGEALYSKVVTIATGPNATLLTTAHGITGLDMNKPIDIDFSTYDGTFHFSGATNMDPLSFLGYTVSVDATNINWTSSFNMTAFEAKCRLVYAK